MVLMSCQVVPCTVVPCCLIGRTFSPRYSSQNRCVCLGVGGPQIVVYASRVLEAQPWLPGLYIIVFNSVAVTVVYCSRTTSTDLDGFHGVKSVQALDPKTWEVGILAR